MTLHELWQKRKRLIEIVEHDPTCGKWKYQDWTNTHVPNEKGSRLIRRICSTYEKMRKNTVDRWIEEGMMDEWMITREFIGFDGNQNYWARDYAYAYIKGADMPIIK